MMFKYKLLAFLFFISLLLVFNYVSAESKTMPLLSKVIYIDVGHGGADSGAYYEGVKEADLNLQISKRLMKALKKEGATIYLTRYDDYDLSVINAYNRKRSDLSRRANIINKSGAWFSYNDEKLGQGREKAKEFLEQNPDILHEIEAKVREIIANKNKSDAKSDEETK